MQDILQENVNITSLSNFKTKAKTKYYYEINSYNDIENLIKVFNFIKEKNLKFIIIWWWTNLLFAFDVYDWLVINNNLKWWKYDTLTKKLESYSSDIISDIASALEENYDQWLWHRFIWLPGTIWWAVVWNAGCFWLETENNFYSAKALNIDSGQIETLSKKDMLFSYRSSVLKETWKYFLISVCFDLSKKIEKYSSDVDNIYFRETKQPAWNTCGSFFKNPSRDLSAWKAIEDVWLKGLKLWKAFFSNKHANFLINGWESNYKDLINLIELAQKKVKEKFEIELVPEVRIIKN